MYQGNNGYYGRFEDRTRGNGGSVPDVLEKTVDTKGESWIWWTLRKEYGQVLGMTWKQYGPELDALDAADGIGISKFYPPGPSGRQRPDALHLAVDVAPGPPARLPGERVRPRRPAPHWTGIKTPP